MPLVAPTLRFLEAHAALGTRGVVAVSGGADSVALAHVLARLAREGHLAAVVLAHLNHQLRGADSDADQDFVESLPRLWSMPELTVRTRRIDVAARAGEEGWNLEDAGRRLRFPFFAEVARDASARWVATAHTADDQAETVLFRLLRGAGVKGLAGIPRTRPLEGDLLLVRPWLDIFREQVRSYLEHHGLPFREDASNRDRRFARNRLRHELIPLLKADFQPALVEILTRLAEQAGEMASLLTQEAEALLHRVEKPRAGRVLVFAATEVAAAPPLVAREMFRLVWQREAWPLAEMGFEEWSSVLRVARGEQTAADLPGRITARRRGAVLQIGSPP